MAAAIINLAEAIVTQLNTATFSQAVTATRAYVPRLDLSDLYTLHVTVVPRQIESERLDRHRHVFEYSLDLAVQKKAPPTEENLDALMELVEEIAAYLRATPLFGYPAAACSKVANDPIYAAEHLKEFRQFTSVLRVTYKVWGA